MIDKLGNKLDEKLIADVLAKARLSPRLRANHCFHRPEDRLQRMINAALAGTYFAPHRHRNPDKLEIFTILKGKAIVIAFDDAGVITERCILGADGSGGLGSARQAEIPPGVWHTLLILSPEAVLYEVIDGHYDPATHKRFAPFAPPESDAEAGRAYVQSLRERCSAH